MKKEKDYQNTRFSAETLREAYSAINEIAMRLETELSTGLLVVEHKEETWNYDTLEEFLADYRKYNWYATFSLRSRHTDLFISIKPRSAEVQVTALNRVDIEAIFSIFEKNIATDKLQPLPKPPDEPPTVFIGHGHNFAWKELKDHLHEKHGFVIEAYETGARAGHTVRDALEDMVNKSSFAILVFTAEDAQMDGSYRARQNIIHEAGLFQGRLGFPRAIMLLEEGVEEFSNVQGVQYIRFSKDNIKETYGEILATLRREFPK